jgi:excisionase family DNA binding protein
MTEEYLTISELAKELRVSDATIRRSIQSGKLEVYRVGSQQIRISREQVQSYLVHCQPKKPVAPAQTSAVTPLIHRPTPRNPTDRQPANGNVHAGQIDSDVTWKVIEADALAGLRLLDDQSINCIITSPPYYWQRDYEVDGQLGHEATVEGYVSGLQAVFREAKRTLREDGVFFLNIGDTYYSAKGRPHGSDLKHHGRQLSRRKLRAVDGPGLNVPRKSLLGIPWKVALALQQDDWVLRSSIIWQRPAPMPEPTAHDRPWRTYEHVFLFSKQPRYWFDRKSLNGDEDVWRMSARPTNTGSHFAPFPLEFADRCVAAGCPENGVVLDPFVGSGTTMFAALNRRSSAVGIDLKKEYCQFVRDQILSKYPPAKVAKRA